MKNQLLFVGILAILSAATAVAQPVGGMTNAKRIKFAEDKMAQGDLYNALDWYEKAFQDDDKNVTVIGKIAQLNYKLRDFKKAEQWFSRLLTADKKGEFADSRFLFARCLKMNGKYDDAATQFQKFIADYKGTDLSLKKLAANELLGAEMGREMKEDPNVRIENAGQRINSAFSEFSPYPVSNDELYYGSIRSDSVIVLDDKKNDFYAQIYSAKREEKGFGEAKVVPNVNSIGSHTGNMTLTPNKNTMYYTRCQLNNNVLKHCDVFVTKRANGGEWSESIKVTGVNSDESTTKQPAIGSMNGKVGMFFSSDRPGGQGGWDIYFAEMLPDETFVAPQNLGDKVNTVGDEETPFYKNGTLYFASNGQPTIGGYDIFSTKVVGAAAETPKNLGKGINSRVDDMYFTIADNDYQGYIVSNRPGGNSLKSETCCDDIWTIDLPFTNEVLVTSADRDSKVPLNKVKVRLIEIGAKKTDVKTNPIGNDVTFTMLPVEKKYKIIGSLDGYYSDSTEITTVGFKKPTNLTAFLKLVKKPEVVIPPKPTVQEIKEYISFHNIYWDFDRWNVRPVSALTMDTVVNILNAHNDWVVEVGSHTDALGSNNYNDGLSDRRTKAAVDYLTKKGIPATQLVPTHFGEAQPVAPNDMNGKDNPGGRQANRRTEFRILKGGVIIKTITAPTSSTTQKTGMQVVEEYGAKKKLEDMAHVTWLGGNTHDFGDLKKGTKVTHTFEFINDGKMPLSIEFAAGGCDCTKVDDYSKKPVAPGQKGFLKITFDTTEKDLGKAKGDANFMANTDPVVTEVKVSANVTK